MSRLVYTMCYWYVIVMFTEIIFQKFIFYCIGVDTYDDHFI